MGTGVIELTDIEKLLLTGPQALWFLDQLLTNQLDGLQEGTGKQALLLTPKGRITAVTQVWSTDSGVLVQVEPGHVQPLAEFLQLRVFATKVQIRSVSDDFRIVRILGPEAGRLVAAAFGEREMPEGYGSMVSSPLGFIGSLAPPLEGLDLWIRQDAADEPLSTLAEAGGERLSRDEYESFLVGAGVPRFGVDFDSSYLPQEAALERAVHFEKGCYLGQEAVAMAQRGRVRRRLRHLRFDGQPRVGPVLFHGQKIGQVTSIGAGGAGSFGIGTVVTSTEAGAKVEVEGIDGPVAAVVEQLPGTVSGPALPSARELRERLQGTATP